MHHSQHKVSPINIRALPSQRDLIDRAAMLSNKNRSDFILEVACKEAENILLDQRLFMVDDETYAKFEALLEAPVGENSGLKSLLKSKSPWEK
jgi:uncharacterized protein (DUF1778 family)